MSDKHTKEPQYQITLDIQKKQGLTSLGLMSNQVWYDDPRRLTFLLARYKFVAKMFEGYGNVLEVGCADAFGTRVVLQTVDKMTAVDFDPVFIEDVKQRQDAKWVLDARVHDMLDSPVAPGNFDGAFALDVLEHIQPDDEYRFLRHIVQSLSSQGTLIIGMPSLESQEYASPPSKAGHVNCKTGPDLKETLSRHFHHVFLFGMNDEVLHTGYAPMCHYRLALCTNPR